LGFGGRYCLFLELLMTTQEFDVLQNNVWDHALQARNFAVSLESQEPKTARVWHALADRLYEAADQMDNMSKIIIPARP
jgi:hypothetical protein